MGSFWVLPKNQEMFLSPTTRLMEDWLTFLNFYFSNTATMSASISLISDFDIDGLSIGTFKPIGEQMPSFSIGINRDLDDTACVVLPARYVLGVLSLS